MKSWTVVSLMNKSQLPVRKKGVYIKKAIKRLKISLNREHILAMNLSPVDTAKICKNQNIPISISEINRSSKIDAAAFYEVAKVIKPTHADVVSCFSFSFERRKVIQTLRIPVTVEEVLGCPSTDENDLRYYVGLLDRTPTRQEIIAFCARNGSITFACDACKAFGYNLEFEDIYPYIRIFSDPTHVYESFEMYGIKVPTQYMINRMYPMTLFIRQMWKHACPTVYNMVPDPRYGPAARLQLWKAKRSIRVIQRFARFCIRNNAAKKIQRRWRKCVSDPSYRVARLRLIREFECMK